MSEVLQKDIMLSYLASAVESNSSEIAIKEINERGIEKLSTADFPTRKDEDWRFIDLRSISRNTFYPVEQTVAKEVGDISEHYLPEALDSRLVFVNGEYVDELSSMKDFPKGVIVGNLTDNAGNEVVKTHLG